MPEGDPLGYFRAPAEGALGLGVSPGGSVVQRPQLPNPFERLGKDQGSPAGRENKDRWKRVLDKLSDPQTRAALFAFANATLNAPPGTSGGGAIASGLQAGQEASDQYVDRQLNRQLARRRADIAERGVAVGEGNLEERRRQFDEGAAARQLEIERLQAILDPDMRQAELDRVRAQTIASYAQAEAATRPRALAENIATLTELYQRVYGVSEEQAARQAAEDIVGTAQNAAQVARIMGDIGEAQRNAMLVTRDPDELRSIVAEYDMLRQTAMQSLQRFQQGGGVPPSDQPPAQPQPQPQTQTQPQPGASPQTQPQGPVFPEIPREGLTSSDAYKQLPPLSPSGVPMQRPPSVAPSAAVGPQKTPEQAQMDQITAQYLYEKHSQGLLYQDERESLIQQIIAKYGLDPNWRPIGG